MPNYQLGKIYKIINTINANIYYGSSVQPLCRRMAVHRQQMNRESSPFCKAMKSLGVENFRIILVRAFPCNSKDELEAEEYRTMQFGIAAGETLYNDRISRNMSEAQKIKQSIATKGIPKSAETKAKMSLSQMGALNHQFGKRSIPKIHNCEACEYHTTNISHFNRHMSGRKHKLEYDEYVFDVEMDRLADIAIFD